VVILVYQPVTLSSPVKSSGFYQKYCFENRNMLIIVD